MKLVALFLGLLLCSCVTQPKALEPVATNGTGPSRDIHVVSHGKHTGLILEADAVNKHLPDYALPE